MVGVICGVKTRSRTGHGASRVRVGEPLYQKRRSAFLSASRVRVGEPLPESVKIFHTCASRVWVNLDNADLRFQPLPPPGNLLLTDTRFRFGVGFGKRTRV